MLHPAAEPRVPYVAQCLNDRPGPVIAASDYMKVFTDQIRCFVPTRSFLALGTDGYGRSDTRKALRRFFEVDRHYVAVAAMKALADENAVPQSKVTEAMRKYGVDPEKPEPTTV
jgi:pyruvate dehydrogenase E1 component